jgi:hypothetical protein
MGVKFRTGTRFRAASTLLLCIHIIFLILPSRITFCRFTIFCSLPNNFCFELTPIFIPCRLTSVSNSLRLLFPAEYLPFPTHSDFYSLPNNFRLELTPTFIPCRITSVSNSLRLLFPAEPLYRWALHDILLFPRTPFELKEVTRSCLARTRRYRRRNATER